MQCTSQTPRTYRVLSPNEREEIMIGLRTNESIRSIAGRLNRNASVISREIKTNSTEEGRYQCYWAQKRSERRRRNSRRRQRIADGGIRHYLHEKLKENWSPEQIAGRIPMDLPGKRVSHETIYQYVFKQERSLTQYLQCGRKQRRKRKNKRAKRVMIPVVFVKVLVASTYSNYLGASGCVERGYLGYHLTSEHRLSNHHEPYYHIDTYPSPSYADRLCSVASPVCFPAEGFRRTSTMGSQFLVLPDHRLGFLLWACSYTSLRFIRICSASPV